MSVILKIKMTFMRFKILTITFSLLLSLFNIANAQIKESSAPKYTDIGKVGGGMGPFVSSLSVIKNYNETGTNAYLWMYNNLKYTSITDLRGIKFFASDEELEGLFNILKTQVNSEKGTEKLLELGKQSVNIVTTKNMGVASLIIYDLSTAGGFFYLTSKQIDKLFGK